MPVSTEWFNEEKTIIVMTMVGTYTWPEYYAAIDDSITLTNSVNHRVDYIADYTQAPRLPEKALANMPQVTKKTHDLHPDGIFVGVGLKTGMGRIGTNIFNKIYGSVHLVDDMAEAVSVIEAKRSEA